MKVNWGHQSLDIDMWQTLRIIFESQSSLWKSGMIGWLKLGVEIIITIFPSFRALLRSDHISIISLMLGDNYYLSS